MRFFSLFSSLILATSFSSVAASAAQLTPADLENLSEYVPFEEAPRVHFRGTELSSIAKNFYMRAEDVICAEVLFAYGPSPQIIFKNKPITAEGEKIIITPGPLLAKQLPGTVTEISNYKSGICHSFPQEGIIRFDLDCKNCETDPKVWAWITSYNMKFFN